VTVPLSENPFRHTDPGPYLHVVTIGRQAAGGSTDPVTGKFVPGPGGFSYAYGTAAAEAGTATEPNADCQDQRKVITRDESGTPTVTAEAAIYLADEHKIRDIEPGMTGKVWGEEFGPAPGIDFQVVGTQWLDGCVFVNWL
jgi:hypothetical protein